MFELNAKAAALCQFAMDDADRLKIEVVSSPSGATVLDFGVDATGGLAAGALLAEICMAGLGTVRIVPDSLAGTTRPAVQVTTDNPIAACMASQYAGWQISHGKYFAMGSGPMRSAAGKEKLFGQIGHREQPEVAVGVLETAKLPSPEVCQSIASDCRVSPDALYLLVAPTSSLAGSIQIVARTIETALHKMHELGFDIRQVQHGFGLAPLPPIAADDITAIGRTNDAVLYGGRITLWVTSDDEQIEQFGPRVPSIASKDYGRPFAEIFDAYDRDFYKIDPHLFSPAEITLVNLSTGNSASFGGTRADLLQYSHNT